MPAHRLQWLPEVLLALLCGAALCALVAFGASAAGDDEQDWGTARISEGVR